MRIMDKRFAGKDFRAVQIIPLMWRVKFFLIFVVPALVLFYFWPGMWEAAREGSSFYYLLMIVPVALTLGAVSFAVRRVVVYADPQDKTVTVVSAGLVLSREKLNIPISEVTGVSAETKVIARKGDESGESVRKTKTVLVVTSGKGALKLWTYSKAAHAQKAARLIEELLKS